MLRARLLTLLLLVSAIGSGAAAAASAFDPALRFRTISTEHFVIYFHQGEDRLAARLATIAEDTWHTLQQSFGTSPPRRTHVVLVDQTETANGFATPLPYDTVVVTAAWPAGVEFIGDTTDWLRLVFTHEFTHIVHLDRSVGWARVARGVFGRMPFAFPNLYLPTWQIEGLATYEESIVTGHGRLHAGDFAAIVREDARRGRLQPLDRVNGGLVDWPGGTAAYAYGLGFHEYLSDRFGQAALGRLADATAGRVPYTTSRVFPRVFGESLGALWRDYQSAMLESAKRTPPRDVAVQRLTHSGFVVNGPRFDRFAFAGSRTGGAGTSGGSVPPIVYSLQSPHDFPALYRFDGPGAAPRRLTTRYLGATTAIGRNNLYFDQQEIRRSAGVYSDLYELSRANGAVRRLTSEARLLDPDLSPDESSFVCVREDHGQRDLVLVRLEPAFTITPLIAEIDTQFNAPKWSPDGRTVAVERHRPGRLSEIVTVDISTRAVATIASDERTRFVTPAWRPDGRAIVAAASPRDEPFNLFEFSLDRSTQVRQLTFTTGGATWPDISSDGRTIVFVGYTADGFDVFLTPYDADSGSLRAQEQTSAQPDPGSAANQQNAATAQPPLSDARRYSPWPTLRPTSWSPIVESDSDQLRLGAAVSGVDALRYHTYAATATWLMSAPEGSPAVDRAIPDWQLYYAYARWWPTMWTSAESTTIFFAGPANAAGAPTAATLRERTVEAGVLLPFLRTRRSQQALFSVVHASDEYAFSTRTVTRDRTAGRAAFAMTTAHSYGDSISPEGGFRAGATIEAAREALGSSGDATIITGDARAYLPGLAPHHVLAVRVAGARSTGEPGSARTYRLGGADANASVISFSQDAFSLLRGFPSNQFAGTRVALLNADYRFPLAWPQRGVGTWPGFLRNVHGAVFLDAGNTWTDTFRAGSTKTSIGGELSTDIVAGYFFPFTIAIGAARGHDGSGTIADRSTIYVRLGRAF